MRIFVFTPFLIFFGLLSFGPVHGSEQLPASPTPTGTHVIDGESINPFGYPHGTLINLADAPPRVGDLVVFECSRQECSGAYVKKVIRQRDDCYWVEGRDDIWMGADGKRKYSVDSRTTFGWMCSEDITILGVAQRAV